MNIQAQSMNCCSCKTSATSIGKEEINQNTTKECNCILETFNSKESHLDRCSGK